MTAFHVIRFLAKVFPSGQDTGKQAVCDMLRDNLRRTSPDTIAKIKCHLGQAAALLSQKRIDQLLAQ